MVIRPSNTGGTFHYLKILYDQGGIKNVYKGTTATLFRDMPATGFFFMSYESLVRIVVSKDTSQWRLLCLLADCQVRVTG